MINFHNYNIIDKRCIKPFDFDLQFTGHLRTGEMINGVLSPNQVEIVNAFLSNPASFIIAPPRTGKSVIGVAISCKLKVKTLIIANQIDLLQNFYKSFERDTNLLQLRQEFNVPIVKIIESPKDFQDFLDHPENYDVILSTYQRFIKDTETESKMSKFKTVKNKFGLFIIDEAHTAGALEFLRFIGSLDCKYRLGLTATPIRKDKLDNLTTKIIGNISYKANNLSLIPELQIRYTNIKINTPHTYNQQLGFVKYINNLYKNSARHTLIINDIFEDLKLHQCIIIPMDRIQAEQKLVNDINKKAIELGYCIPGEKICETFSGAVGQKIRKQVLANINEGKTRVVCATLSIMQQGIDMTKPTLLYFISCLSAKPGIGSPKFFQLVNRICTPAPNKSQPIVKLYIDDSSISRGCIMSLWRHEIQPGTRNYNLRSTYPVYKLAENFKKDLFQSMKDPKYANALNFRRDDLSWQ